MAVLGIDTHKDTHAAIVLDDLGRIQVAESFGTTDRDNLRLIRWAQTHGPVSRAGVEGTGSYGYRLARALDDVGIQVIEVSRPDRALRRRKGKTDLVDPRQRLGRCSPRTPPRSPRIVAAPSVSCGVW